MKDGGWVNELWKPGVCDNHWIRAIVIIGYVVVWGHSWQKIAPNVNAWP